MAAEMRWEETMTEAFLCDAVRTPIGRYAGALAGIRADDLGALPMAALKARHADLDWAAIDDVAYGCANQAGEDNRDVARMALLLAGLPETVPGATVNRLCGSGMEAIAMVARAIRAGDGSLFLAGGVESMSRAPFVMGKATSAFARDTQMFDTTIGWRFVNPKMHAAYGTDSMPETAENVATEFGIARADQDAFAWRSQQRAGAAQARGRFAREIVPVKIQHGRETVEFAIDEHPRADTTLERLAKLPTPFRAGGSVTAGNASGVNDGACCVIVATEEAAKRNGLTPRARIVATAVAGVAPRIMGFGPAPATRKLLDRVGLTLKDIDVIELNEAFAAQALAVTRDLGLADDAEHVNPNGGAIALGHPLGMSGARLVTTALFELEERRAKRAICTMCIGVGQGIAMLIERV
jgi:acetyl-CoA acyltransferase